MRNKHLLMFSYLTILALFFPLTMAANIPVRGSSQNGKNPDAATWNLLGRSRRIKLEGNEQKVTMTRQLVCLKEDVEDSLPKPNLFWTGTCDSGAYLHLFQFESEDTDVTINIGDLVNFVKDKGSKNYGVMICDDSNRNTGNTIELCTNDPLEKDIPEITFTVSKDRTTAHFIVSRFPHYPCGKDNQGRGLTLYLITGQRSHLPIQLPTVSIR
jgi:hypothetical protein